MSNDTEIEENLKSGVERELQTVGMTTFIEYCEYLDEGITNSSLVEIMLRDHPEWKETTARTKAATIKRIFKRGMAKDCFTLIVKSNNFAITDDIREQARDYLRKS